MQWRIEFLEKLAMYFDGRELPPHAEPVSSTELLVGTCYFAVNYADDEMLFPIMETLVFIGKNLGAGDVGTVYFQDIESYREGVRYEVDLEDELATFQTGSENELGHIFHFEKAIEVLMRCSLRRKERGV